MYISRINAFTPTMSYNKNQQIISFSRNRKKTIPDSSAIHQGFTCENYIDIDSAGNASIFGLQEILALKDFALECKDNVALKIIPGPLIDGKYVKSQTDLIRETGKWLDITDYNDM